MLSRMSAQVVRWRKYGKDRLYVTAGDGTKLGFRDVLTGRDEVQDLTRAAEFEAAVAEWQALPAEAAPTLPAAVDLPTAVPEQKATAVPDQRPAVVPSAPAHPQELVATPDTDEEDLAQRRAGALAREQALALKEAAPVRTFLARVLRVHTEERAWRIGADGEEKVAAELAKLAQKDPRWTFLHAIPVGERGSDIDHLVVGPGGVFSLNAKHHPGSKVWVGGNTFMVNGQRQPYVRNSRHEALRAGRLLSAVCGFPVSVTGMVVPVGADELTIKAQPQDVHVVNRMRLARWLRDRPQVLSDEQVEAVFAAARRSITWSSVR